ncbi:MAG TPA: nicotinate-nucleotide adenylyltransferase [Gammaproteobacteria bacterium]|nr:nicotinate-nucleotide adenylyltransferase [Gammaproteobacteria bacterium]
MIGILGGSFDPIHIGHLRLALELYQELGLQQVRLIPAGAPPHRGAPIASAQQRLAMVQVAIAGEAGLCADAREIERGGPSYTVDTLNSLRAELGDTPLGLIVGMDAFLGLPTWRRWRELFELAHIIVVHRPGSAVAVTGELADLFAERHTDKPQRLAEQAAGHILTWPVSQLDISSTHIRELLKTGKSIRYLVPDAVAIMIKASRLYQTENQHLHTAP